MFGPVLAGHLIRAPRPANSLPSVPAGRGAFLRAVADVVPELAGAGSTLS
jgi:hypothetical protein